MEFEKNLIYIDSREKHRIKRFIKYVENNIEYLNDSKNYGLKPIYEKIENGEKWYEITTLEYGDFIYNDLVFEYKTEEDFIDSTRHGNASTRLNTQIDEMNRFAEQNIVYTVLEGDKNNIQSEFFTRISVKTGFIIEKYQNECFKMMLYAMKLSEKLLISPTKNLKSNNIPRGERCLISMGYPLKQAKAINKKYEFRDINEVIEVFSQDFTSFKKESKVKYLNKEVYMKAQRWLGL